jgi:murein L,D-transpeptidase YafK
MTVASRKRRSLTTIIVLGSLTAIVGGVLTYYWPAIYEALEHEVIRAERAKRWSLAATGQTLPGTPDLANLQGRLASQKLEAGAPVFIRIFKRDFELELWMRRDGRFHRFATYPICLWSGHLGPKHKEGDRQSPEGFYTVDAKALNRASKYHRSFNLGFPNTFDRSHARSGSFLMVHGGCASIGCYAMTNGVIDEIWTLISAALKSGQERFQVQVFPFRMTERNMTLHAHSAEAPFWQQLKKGHDIFEDEKLPPRVSVCQGRYVFQRAGANTDGSGVITDNCSDALAGN